MNNLNYTTESTQKQNQQNKKISICIIGRLDMYSWCRRRNKHFHIVDSPNTRIISINGWTHYDGQYKEDSPVHNVDESKVLKLWFDDVCGPESYNDMDCLEFSEDDAKQIVEFVKSFPTTVDTIIVHCAAGISRSAAVGVVLSQVFENSELFKLHSISPNPLVMKLLSKEFKIGYYE